MYNQNIHLRFSSLGVKTLTALCFLLSFSGCGKASPSPETPENTVLEAPSPTPEILPSAAGAAETLPSPTEAPRMQESPPPSLLDTAPVVLPPPPYLTPEGESLIFEFEGFDARPAWPQGASGVTVGWGYDCGYYSPNIIKQDWHKLSGSYTQRLADTSGLTGRRAQAKISGLRDILIAHSIGDEVFRLVDVAREFKNCTRTFPGFDSLRPNAQAALMSLTFNRGTSMIGDNRREMRNIRDYVPKMNYGAMASEFRKMIRVWKGTVIERGMTRRRNAEAKLMETP